MHDLLVLLEHINKETEYTATMRYNTDYLGGMAVDLLLDGVNLWHCYIDDPKEIPVLTEALEQQVQKPCRYRVSFYDEMVSIDEIYVNKDLALEAKEVIDTRYNVNCYVEPSL